MVKDNWTLNQRLGNDGRKCRLSILRIQTSLDSAVGILNGLFILG